MRLAYSLPWVFVKERLDLIGLFSIIVLFLASPLSPLVVNSLVICLVFPLSDCNFYEK